jgi:delta-1-pyrroline-5-carboxylate synthetase
VDQCQNQQKMEAKIIEDPRAQLVDLKRVIVKIGTAIVTNDDGTVALGRVGQVVEQICKLVHQVNIAAPQSLLTSYLFLLFPKFLVPLFLHVQGKEIILVSSGAVGLGTRRLGQQALLSTPIRSHLNPTANKSESDLRAFAAGQSTKFLLFLHRLLLTLQHPETALLVGE